MSSSDHPSTPNYHMTPDEFRHYGRAVVDWIVEYYERVEVLPGIVAGAAGRGPAGPAGFSA